MLLAFGTKAEAALKLVLLWVLAAHWRDMAADVSRVREVGEAQQRGRRAGDAVLPRLGLALLSSS